MKKLVLIFTLTLITIFSVNGIKTNAEVINYDNDYFRMPDAVLYDNTTLVYPSIYLDFNRQSNYTIINLVIDHNNLILDFTGREVLIAFDSFTQLKYGVPTVELLVNKESIGFINNQTMSTGILTFLTYINAETNSNNDGERFAISLSWQVYTPLDEVYQQGYNNGYNTGYNIGLNENNLEVFEDGYEEGYSDGKAYGLSLGQEDAYNEGYNDGANDSFLGNFDKWIVPAIIVVMFVGGFFAVVRMKRDNL